MDLDPQHCKTRLGGAAVPEQPLSNGDGGDAEEEKEGAQHGAGQAAVPHMAAVAPACTQH